MSKIKPVKVEIDALVPLLEQDWETPEVLAAALIQALDKARAERKLWVGVMQFGGAQPGKPGMSGPAWYVGVGPYPGATSARNAIEAHPSAGMATALAIVPLRSPEGLQQLLREVG